MDTIARTYNWNDNALMKMHQTITRCARSKRHPVSGKIRHLATTSAWEQQGMRHLAFTLLAAPTLIGVMTPAVGAEMSGKEVFDHYCTHCHGSGDGPGTLQLSRTRGDDKGLLTQRDRSRAGLHRIHRSTRLEVHAPAFVPSDLTDARLKALLAFLTKQPGGPGK